MGNAKAPTPARARKVLLQSLEKTILIGHGQGILDINQEILIFW